MTEARRLIKNLRTDCVHYLGDRPCRPHVEAGHRCTCIHFQPTKRRGVIIKLGAAGDVLRSTPLLRALDPAKTGTKILWVTHSPDLLPNEAREAGHPTAATLARIAQGTWDFCWNLDKDPEACAIAASTKATEYRGYTLREGVPYPVDKAAWHKFATGIDNPYSRRNRQSYVEEIFDIAGYPSGRRILDSRYDCHCKGKAAHVSTERFCSPPKHWGRKALAFSNLAGAVLD